MKKYPTPTPFYPRNPKKYAGDAGGIIVRSSYERKLMIWLDTNPSVLKWASEEMSIPYISPIDNKQHRYFVDFIVQFKTRDGTIKTSLIEVKPLSQSRPPPPPKKKVTKGYLNEVMTWEVNKAKWNAATEYARRKGMDFVVITERELGL